MTYMAARAQLRTDVTEEGLSQLTSGTLEVIEGITAERPVTVHAFISNDVPGDYATTRSRLLNILREMEARGGEGLAVRIVAPKLYSPEAEEAMEDFGIMPRPVTDRSSGRMQATEIFLGVAFVSGPREEVVAFMDRGLSPEYEVSRALRVVTQESKKVIGVLRTDATIMGNFDLQSRQQQPSWQIVEALRKQYEVRSLNPKTPVPEDVDVLLVPQLPSLAQDELATVKAYVDAGRPALITVDPFPLFDIRLSPREEKLPPPGQQGGPFGGAPPGEPKGDYGSFLREIGVEWQDDTVLYDTYKPDAMFESAPPQIIFVSERPDGSQPFAADDPVVAGLTQVVVMHAGELRPAAGHDAEFTPLLSTGRTAGYNKFDDLVQRHPLFGLSMMPPRTRSPIDGKTHVLAARIQGGGGASGAEGEEPAKDRNLVVIADLDLFGDVFFQMEMRGGDLDDDGLPDVRFDNVPFLLNVIDALAGDDRFIELRKRRSEFRRLTEIDERTEEARNDKQRAIDEANKAAEAELEEAQKALDAAVAVVRERTDLDDTTKAIMLKSAEEAENRRLQAKQEKIEQKKEKTLYKNNTEYKRAVDRVQNNIRLVAVMVPPIPALLLGMLLFWRKRRRERETIPTSRSATANRVRGGTSDQGKGDVA
jgi:ABC-2 type transport system permease protein